VAADGAMLRALAAEIAAAPQWSAAVWQEVLRADAGKRRESLIAEADGEALGFVVANLVADVAEIESIAVAESAQRSGVGRMLMQAIVQAMRERGGRVMELEVRASNARAIAFYAALGFQEQGRRVKYYSQPAEDALLFSRLL
jgi:ribosomal-protein-alanine acetyltransferase